MKRNSKWNWKKKFTSKAIYLSELLREETPSATIWTSTPLSRRSRAVCKTQTWAWF